jgi:predicted DNA-binding protein (MmcQ/YjbR family)
MTLAEYNAFCSALPATSHVVQWGGADVWKVGGKVFALGSNDAEEALWVSFKCSPMAYEMLRDAPGCRPAPYLASRGMKWIQRFSDESLPDDAFRDYLRESHRLVAAGLTKKARADLGLSG